jgi:predicted phage terminase large subunit-like protein
MYVRSQKGFGQGADWVIWDDIVDPQKRHSMASTQEANKHLTKLVTRLDNKKDGRILGIMQRISHNDPTARCIEAGGYTVLSLEFKATNNRIISLGNKEYNIKKGEYLCPQREDENVEKMLRSEMDDYSFNAQYQQNPIPPDGNLFKSYWIQYYDHLDDSFTPKGMNVYILVDPANEKKDTSDYTAMVVIGLAPDQNYYVLDIVRDRLNPTERIKKLFDLHGKWNKRVGRPPTVGYEKYGLMADTHFIAETQRMNNYRFHVIELHTPVRKEDRIRELVPLFQQQRVYLPKYLMYYNYKGEELDLVDSFIQEEYMAFPDACIHDDMLDAMARITDAKLGAFFPKEQPGISISIAPRFGMHEEGNPQDDWMNW